MAILLLESTMIDHFEDRNGDEPTVRRSIGGQLFSVADVLTPNPLEIPDSGVPP